jgi:hypothetical protein
MINNNLIYLYIYIKHNIIYIINKVIIDIDECMLIEIIL